VTPRTGRSEKTAMTVSGTFVCMLLGIWGAPVSASSGIGAHELAASAPSLNVERVDFSSATAAIGMSTVTTNEEIAGENHGSETTTDAVDLIPRAETVNQHIFENSHAPERPATDLIEADVPEVAPLASSNAPVGAKKNDSAAHSESVTTSVETRSSEVEMHLPGVSDADLLRFRRQMYRTDI
jgi:hypothetical protein